MSRDLELSLVAALELKPFVKLPPQILLEPQDLLAGPYAGLNELPEPLLSAVAAVPRLVKDRDYVLLAANPLDIREVSYIVGESHAACASCGIKYITNYVKVVITVCFVARP